jgi:hypothetical protein
MGDPFHWVEGAYAQHHLLGDLFAGGLAGRLLEKELYVRVGGKDEAGDAGSSLFHSSSQEGRNGPDNITPSQDETGPGSKDRSNRFCKGNAAIKKRRLLPVSVNLGNQNRLFPE